MNTPARPWSAAPVVEVMPLPGPPLICAWCSRRVRLVVWTPQARWCPCGANIDHRLLQGVAR